MAEKIVIDLDFDVKGSEVTLGQLEKRAELLNEELRKVPQGSKAFKELRQELVKTNKEIKNTELAMESLDNEQVASELGSVAGAVGDVTAAFILLGGDEDSAIGETAKRIETALGVTMAFKGGIEGIISFQKLWNNVLKQTAVVQGIYNAGQKAMTFVTNATTIATKALRVAMLTLPFVAIGAAVAALASNFKGIMKSFGFFNEEAQALKDTMDAFKSGTADATKQVSEMEASFNLAKKGLISKEQALFEYNETFGKTLGAAKDFNEAEQIFIDKSDDYIKAAGLRAQADALFAKAAEKSADAMLVHMEDNLTAADKAGASLSAIKGGVVGFLLSADDVAEDLSEKQKQRTKEAQKLLTEQSDLFTQMATGMLKEAQNIENEANITSEKTNEFEENTDEKRNKRAKARAERRKKEEKEIEDRLKREQQAIFDLQVARMEADANDILDARQKAEALIEIEKFKHEKELEDKKLTDAEKELLEFEYWERVAQISQDAIDKELEQEQEKADALAELDKQAKKDKAESDKEFEDEQKQLRQDIIDAEIGLQDAKLNAAKGLIAGLTELAGENEKLANALFIADKALAIGEIVVNTQREIAGIFAAYSTIPGGQAAAIPLAAAAKIRAATSIATIVASSIAKFKGGGGASIGGAGGGSIAGAGTTAPTLSPITNTSTLVPQEPQQVFVTETDITNVQNQVAVIETQATIK